MNIQHNIKFTINILYKVNYTYINNINNYYCNEYKEIYNLFFNKINLNNYENIDFNNKLKKYKNNLLIQIQRLNYNNTNCYLKNFCVLYCLIIDKITNKNYLDNNIITEHLNNLAKNNNTQIVKTLNEYNYFEYNTNYDSNEILIYLCHNKLYNFNNNDMQNYYNFLLKNTNDIHHKRFLGTLLYSGYDIKYNHDIYDKNKIIKFAKLINNYIFINFDDIKLYFNALFYNNINDKINFNSLINIIFKKNETIFYYKIINYYTEYIEDIHYFRCNLIPFLKLNYDCICLIIDNLIDNKSLDVEKINIIYKSLFYSSNYYHYNHHIGSSKIVEKIFDYIKVELNLDEKFYKNIFNIANLNYLKPSTKQTGCIFYYYFETLEFVIPKIKSFNILYNIFYYDNESYDTNILYNLIDKHFFTQNIFELAYN